MKIIVLLFFLCACLSTTVSGQEKAKNVLLLNAAGNSITLGSPVAVTNNTILLPGTLGLQGALPYISSVAGSIGTTTWLNPGTNGFVLTLSGGIPAWSNLAFVDWQLSGNGGTTPGVGVGQNYLGTSDGQNLIIATSATERMRILSTGNIAINSVTAPQLFTIGGDIGIVGTGSKVTSSGTANELIMEETTDTYGTSRLRMQDRNGSNGALFEQIENAGNPGIDLVDFGFKPGTKVQSNIRLEARTATLRGTPNITSATASEFQFLFGSTTTPQYVLSIGQGATLLEAGNFGIGYSAGSGTFPVASPLEKLDVHAGNIILSNTGTAGVSGTAGILKFQGTRDGISSFAAGAQASNTFNYVFPTAVPTAGQVLTINTISGATPYAVTLNWSAAGTGTVTSVGLSMPNIFTVSNSPVTTSGTLTAAYVSQTQNLVFASPNGSSGTPTFRALAAADLPGSFNGFANPTATIGLAAVNGSATTAMRSDAAPALSQSIAPTWTATHIFNQSIGATTTDGIVLQNTTAAAAGAQQWSPRLHFTGQGWKTTAVAASQTVEWIMENQPQQGAANPGSNLVISEQTNNGGYASKLTLTDLGQTLINAAGAVSNAALSIKGDNTNGGHIQSSQTTAPTIAAGPQLGGAGSSVGISNATDVAGKFTYTTGAGAVAGVHVVITVNKSYSNNTMIVLVQACDQATAVGDPFAVQASATTFNVGCNSNVAAGQTYTMYYHIIQTQ